MKPFFYIYETFSLCSLCWTVNQAHLDRAKAATKSAVLMNLESRVLLTRGTLYLHKTVLLKCCQFVKLDPKPFCVINVLKRFSSARWLLQKTLVDRYLHTERGMYTQNLIRKQVHSISIVSSIPTHHKWFVFLQNLAGNQLTNSWRQ